MELLYIPEGRRRRRRTGWMATLLRKILRFDLRFVVAYAILAVVGAAVLIGVARFRAETRRLALADRG